MQIRLVSKSEKETIQIGEIIGFLLKPMDLILLFGNLGSGKTRFAKGIISQSTGTNIDDIVSPTFTISVRYHSYPTVIHVDLYRLSSASLEEIGIDDLLEQDAVMIVEWAENLKTLPNDSLRVFIDFGTTADSRIIQLDYKENSDWNSRLSTSMDHLRRYEEK